MARVSDDRAAWLACNVLPHEASLRSMLARWKLPHDLAAEDVIQEAYGRLIELPSVDHILDHRSYLVVVARTIILTHVRRARIIPIRSIDANELVSLPSDEPSQERRLSDREQLHLLALAIAELPEPGRTIFRLRRIEGLSYRDIGCRLGLSDNAVQKMMARMMSRIILMLGQGGNSIVRSSMRGLGTQETGTK